MDTAEWLGTWELTEAPGRHTKLYPAGFAHGYQYNPAMYIDKRPRVPEVLPTLNDRVLRAIPVEGSVRDCGATWDRSPQVKFWLDKPKPSLGKRLRDWLRRAA